jgi:hypothetical protein
LVTDEVTTIKAPRILTEDGVRTKPTEEITTVEAHRILIEDGVQTEHSTSRVLDARKHAFVVQIKHEQHDSLVRRNEHVDAGFQHSKH